MRIMPGPYDPFAPVEFPAIATDEFTFLKSLGYEQVTRTLREVSYDSERIKFRVFYRQRTNHMGFTVLPVSQTRVEPMQPVSESAVFYHDAWHGFSEISDRALFASNVRTCLHLFARRLFACHLPLLEGDLVAYERAAKNRDMFDAPETCIVGRRIPTLWSETILAQPDNIR